ncbi:MAG: T9SS type A sorting domain-containing protein [Ignavibacteriales bacterium]|nr:T9SS type A sorting domain-containing protein [Ignavibacteriales bacterium]
MKKLLALIALLSTALFCQWGTEITTTIPITDYYDKLDMVTNRNGNHILIREQTTGNIKFYLLDAQGSVVRSSTLNTSGDYPNIVGSNDKIFALYKTGNTIEIKKTTDAGANWSTLTSLALSTNPCAGIDAVMSYDGVHVVYSQRDYNNGFSNYYEAYYYLFNNQSEWVNYQNVSDETDMTGMFPSVAVSANRVHVSFNKGNSFDPDPALVHNYTYARDKYNSTWQSSQEVYTASMGEKLFVSGSTLFDFYNKYETGGGNYRSDLYVKTRSADGSTWSSPVFLGLYSSVYCLATAVTTTDNVVNLLYSYAGIRLYHRTFDGSNWNTATELSSLDGPSAITATSNDLFAVYTKRVNNVKKFMLRTIDATPLAPTGMQIATASGNHPQISWTRNNEPDINTYKIYRKYGAAAWALLTSVSSTASSYTDATITLAQPNGEAGATIYYKITAVDLNNNASGYSSQVSCVSNDMGIEKRGQAASENKNYSFELSQNYPNPFNPSTSIGYSVPVKGYVTLKIYDLFGSEVAALVNGYMEPGSYSAVFNAAGYASGMYIYKLQVNEMQISKKLTLLK